ncbi:MAG: transcriptional regulator [Verrucomicrobia bacterium]|nr:transcriptional regulator [Verrucomicrobiota bacterium]
MKSGDVVLARIWQADDGMKLRPTVLLVRLPPFGDWLTCGMSTQLRHYVAEFDELIMPDSADFAGSGLRHPSLARLGFLGVVAHAEIGGILGRLAPERAQRLRNNLARLLQAEAPA